MVDKSTAQKLVEEYINASYHVDGDELVIMEEETMEKEYGWIFFYTSRKYLETGDMSHALAGNGPIILERGSGSIIQLGTALPPEVYIKQYEEKMR